MITDLEVGRYLGYSYLKILVTKINQLIYFIIYKNCLSELILDPILHLFYIFVKFFLKTNYSYNKYFNN